MRGSFRAAINDETLSLLADTAGRIGVSGRLVNDEPTFTFASRSPLSVTATGDLDAKVLGSTAADTFDFSGATGDYHLRTRAGEDTIVDGVGNNFLDGGADGDTFVFNREEGANTEVDTILNYSAPEDAIEIEGGHVVSVLPGVAGEVIITLDDGDTIVVRGVHITVSQIAGEVGFLV